MSCSEPAGPAVRFASIDLLRGASIVVMLVLHAIMDTLDTESYISRLGTGSLINILALVLLPLLGGLAGLFLLTSAIGNMVGMTRNLRRGHSPLAIMRKQILGGMMIVVFACFAESVLGYHGALGQLLLNLDDPGSTDYSPMYFRAWHMETLHTIGWATVLNGITHSVLALLVDVQRQTGRVIRIYWGLTVLVVCMTPVIWWLCSWLFPGYPFETNPTTGRPTYLAVIGTSAWHELVILFFVNPLAAPVEPVMPYLATSYLGSIIGLQITRPAEHFDRHFTRRYFLTGGICFGAGTVGFAVLLLKVMRNESLDAMISQYRLIYDHRHHTTENSMPSGWFWQYLILSGAALMISTFMFRLIEFRGHSQSVAVRLAWIRRFGFIAFTIYTIQWVYFIVHYLVSMARGLPPYTLLNWMDTWIVVLVSLLWLHVLMRIWERCGYIGSAEWAIVSVTNRLSTIGKQVSTSREAVKWHQRGRLDVRGVFYGPRWQDLNGLNTLEDERRLIWTAALAGLVFWPVSLVSALLLRSFCLKHPRHSMGVPILLTGIGLVLLVAAVVLLSGTSAADWGLVEPS